MMDSPSSWDIQRTKNARNQTKIKGQRLNNMQFPQNLQPGPSTGSFAPAREYSTAGTNKTVRANIIRRPVDGSMHQRRQHSRPNLPSGTSTSTHGGTNKYRFDPKNSIIVQAQKTKKKTTQEQFKWIIRLLRRLLSSPNPVLDDAFFTNLTETLNNVGPQRSNSQWKNVLKHWEKKVKSQEPQTPFEKELLRILLLIEGKDSGKNCLPHIEEKNSRHFLLPQSKEDNSVEDSSIVQKFAEISGYLEHIIRLQTRQLAIEERTFQLAYPGERLEEVEQENDDYGTD